MLVMGGLQLGYIESFLLLDGGHCFLGGVIQVVCGGDGQAALGQNPLGLVHVGSQQTQENTVTAGSDKNDKKKGLNKVEPDLPSALM